MLYSSSDIKDAVDQGVILRLNNRYKQIHILDDIKLVVAYLSLVIAGAVTWRDLKYGFEYSKYFTAFGTGMFFLLSGLLLIWDKVITKGTVYVGKRENVTLVLKTRVDEKKAVYSCALEKRGDDGTKSTSLMEQNLSTLINSNGFLNGTSLDNLITKLSK